MAMPEFSMRQLLEAGVHFGHHTRRWNPKMRPFIFGVRNGVHILDLQQSVPMLDQALRAVRDIAANGGRVLFVGTKRQAQEKVAESAKRCGRAVPPSIPGALLPRVPLAGAALSLACSRLSSDAGRPGWHGRRLR